MECKTCKNYEPKQKKQSINIKEICNKLCDVYCDGYKCKTCPLDYTRRGNILCEI